MGWNVYVTRRIPDAGLSLLREACDTVDVNPADRVLSREELLDAVQHRDGVLCLLTDRIDEPVFRAAGPGCRVFANFAVGYNNIDVEAAGRLGVRVTNTPGVLDDATADMAWALLFAAARRVVESHRFVADGAWKGWSPMQFLGQDITGRTLGIVGAGRIGTEMALRAAGFRMPVVYYSRSANPDLESRTGARRVDLDELLRTADFISLHVPLSDETRHLIDAAALEKMNAHAVLINTSRGPVVDEAALKDALASGRIAAAGLDVFEHEPALTPGLADLPNVVVCPHIASATFDTRDRMARMAAENLLAVLRGDDPPNAVV